MRRPSLAVLLLAAPLSAQTIPDSTVKRGLDTLHVVQSATTRYCHTSSATGYMKAACTSLDSLIAQWGRLLTAPAPPPRRSLVTVRGHPLLWLAVGAAAATWGDDLVRAVQP